MIAFCQVVRGIVPEISYSERQNHASFTATPIPTRMCTRKVKIMFHLCFNCGHLNIQGICGCGQNLSKFSELLLMLTLR